MFETVCDKSSGVSIDESKREISHRKPKSSEPKDLRSLLIELFGSPLDDIDINSEKKSSSQKPKHSRRHTFPVSIPISNEELLPLKINKKRKSEGDLDLSASSKLKREKLSQVCELPITEFTSVTDFVEIKMEKETAFSSTAISEKCWAVIDVKPEIRDPNSIEIVNSKIDIIDLTIESSEINIPSAPQVENTLLPQSEIKIEILGQSSSQSSENANAPAPSMPLLSPVSSAEAARPESTLPETSHGTSMLTKLLIHTTQSLQTLESNSRQKASSQKQSPVTAPTDENLSVSTNSCSRTQEVVAPPRSLIQEIMQRFSEQQQSSSQQQQQVCQQPQQVTQQQHQAVAQPYKSPNVQNRGTHSGIPPSVSFRQVQQHPSKSPVLTTQSQSVPANNNNNMQLLPTARTDQQLQPPPPKRQKQTGASLVPQPSTSSANNSNLLSTSIPQNPQIQQTLPVSSNRVTTTKTFFPSPSANSLRPIYAKSNQFQQSSNRNQQQQIAPNTQPVPQFTIRPNWNQQQQNQTLSKQQQQQQQQRPAPELIRLHRPTCSPNQYHLLSNAACAEKLFIHVYFYTKWKDSATQFIQQLKFLSNTVFKDVYFAFESYVQQTIIVFGRKMIQEMLSVDVDSFDGTEILNRITMKLRDRGFDTNVYKVVINFFQMLKSCEICCTSPFTQKFFNYIMTVIKRMNERLENGTTANTRVTFTLSQLRQLGDQIRQNLMIANWLQAHCCTREASANNTPRSNSRPSLQHQEQSQQPQPQQQLQNAVQFSLTDLLATQKAPDRTEKSSFQPQQPQPQPQKTAQFSSLADLLATQNAPDRSGGSSIPPNRSTVAREDSVSPRNNTASVNQPTIPVEERTSVQSLSHNNSNLVPTKILPEVNSSSSPSSNGEVAVASASPPEEVPPSVTSVISPVTNKVADDIIDLTWIDEGDEDAMIEEINECKAFPFKMESHEESESNTVSVREVVSPADSGLGSPVHQSEPPVETYKCLCGNEAIFVCACKSSMYCSKECQLQDWTDHQKWCQDGKS